MTSFFDTLSYSDVAKTIDHSLLKPELDDPFAEAGCAVVKVILENAYLTDEQKIRGCRLVEAAGADYVKTSTGYAPTGATVADLKLMKQSVSPRIGIKAAHGIRTLDALLEVLEIGVTRVGATQTAAMLDEFKARKAGATAAAAR